MGLSMTERVGIRARGLACAQDDARLARARPGADVIREPVRILVTAMFVASLMTMPATPASSKHVDPVNGNGTMGHGSAHETQELPRHEAAALAEIRGREDERAAAARARRLTDPALALPEGGDLRIESVETDEFGITHTRLHMTVDGVPLYGRTWNEHTGPRDEEAEEPTIFKRWSAPELARSTAQIDEEEAIRRVHAALGNPQSFEPPRARLYYYPLEPGKPWRLVYLVSTLVMDKGHAHEWRHVVSAESGQVLYTADAGVGDAALSTSSAGPAVTNISTCYCRRARIISVRQGSSCGLEGRQSFTCDMCFSTGGRIVIDICALGRVEADVSCQNRCYEYARGGWWCRRNTP
jgi:hypothetical protein